MQTASSSGVRHGLAQHGVLSFAHTYKIYSLSNSQPNNDRNLKKSNTLKQFYTSLNKIYIQRMLNIGGVTESILAENPEKFYTAYVVMLSMEFGCKGLLVTQGTI